MSDGLGVDPVLRSPDHGINVTPTDACLRVLNGPGKGRVFPLGSMRMLVGRNDPPAVSVEIDLTECELGDHFVVSRRHAEIQWVDGSLQITDLRSQNGTRINDVKIKCADGAQISAAYNLKLGDRIRFADVETEVTTLG